MKHIKFPLAMSNGAQVRDISELRENFDMGAIVKHFSTGKLKQWLENNYYDDIQEELQHLTGGEADFGKRITEALRVTWNDEDSIDIQGVMKKTKLKAELKRYVSEEMLADMEHIAEDQYELQQFVSAGYTTIYLFGSEFMIPEQMENTECIGINEPVVSIECKDREVFRKKKIKLKSVKFADDETKRMVFHDPVMDGYFGLADVLDAYLKGVQRVIGGER